MIGATGLELAVMATTLTYFVPTILEITGPGAATLAPAALAAKAQSWAMLNWVRIAATMTAWCAVLRALSLPMSHGS